MGMLLNGEWVQDDKTHKDGKYVREKTEVRIQDHAELAERMRECPGEFTLIASHSCPWSHRTAIARHFKGLSPFLNIYFAHGRRVRGYSLDDGRPWPVPGSKITVRHLHELYSMHSNSFTGRSTVPVLWDNARQRILSNESSDILRFMAKFEHGGQGGDFDLAPEAMLRAIDEANTWIYELLNNAVYRAGFSKTQSAYLEAVEDVFQSLDALEERFAKQRFFHGNIITETDIRLFVTLVRFDPIYYIAFRCCRRRLIDYPKLWKYARDVARITKAFDVSNLHEMRAAAYQHDTVNFGVIPVAPIADWVEDHGRQSFGPALVGGIDGKEVSLEAS